MDGHLARNGLTADPTRPGTFRAWSTSGMYNRVFYYTHLGSHEAGDSMPTVFIECIVQGSSTKAGQRTTRNHPEDIFYLEAWHQSLSLVQLLQAVRTFTLGWSPCD